jgi:von Willebrand factor A domain-containing protein 7
MNSLKRLSIAILATSVVVVLFQTYAHAFIPGGARAYVTRGKSHETITKDALDDFYRAYGFDQNGLVPLTRSMKDARDKIAEANAEVDDRHPNESAWHCDAENIQACSDKIKNLVQATITALNADNALAARTALGSSLHVLQDFYSHSNWIELGNTTPHPALGG